MEYLYILFAVLSALLAALTVIFSKIGLKNTDADSATALRTTMVLVFAVASVFLSGGWSDLSKATGPTLLFLILSGCATGASWLFYFKALKTGDVNKVTPIDKSSTVLAMLMAFIFLGEELSLYKIIAMVLIGAGTLMMTVNKSNGKSKAGAWLLFAWLSSIFAALTSILSKLGVEHIDSNLATAIRTAVVLVMAWIVVAANGKKNVFAGLDGRGFFFLLLSAAATAGSWLCYNHALQIGDASVVVPIDKLSILPVILFSRVVLKEKLTAPAAAGLVLVCAGTVLTIL